MVKIEEEILHKEDGTIWELTHFSGEDVNIAEMLTEIYTHHWQEIVTTYLIEGAVFELFPKEPKTVRIVDGYLTVETGDWHIHLCVGEIKGLRGTAEQKRIVREMRRVKRGAFIHITNGTCTPESFGLGLWNGRDEQMVTILFPNPYLNDQMERLKEPDWSRLHVWEKLKKDYLK